MVALWVTQPDGAKQLALVIHHYAVDGVSWRVLIDDLQTLTTTEQKPLPAASMSLRAWAELLAQQGQQGARRAEESFWLEQVQETQALPVAKGFKEETNTLGAAVNCTRQFSAENTSRLVAAASGQMPHRSRPAGVGPDRTVARKVVVGPRPKP